MMTIARPAATIPQVVVAAAERFGERTAIADPSGDMSFVGLLDAGRRFAAALIEAGIDPGDRIGIWAFNCSEWIVSYVGLTMAGATLVPINTRFKGREAADILYRSRARALITVRDFLGVDYVEMLASAGMDLPHLGRTVAIGADSSEGAQGWEDFIGSADVSLLASVDERVRGVTPSDPADILFTSGTTGVPKGVVMTHDGTLAVAADWVEMTGLSSSDRYLMINPYFHMFGLKSGILASLIAGATMLPEAILDVNRVLSRVEHERVTVLPGPPTLYQTILDHRRRSHFDLSSLRLAVTGAAEIPVELIRRVHEELPFSTVIAGYGLTEGGTASGTGPEDDFDAIATTVGRPRPGFEVRLVLDDGSDAAPGHPGEIWLRGPSIMSGYLDDREATAAAVVEGGWLRTGDLGTFDAGGRLKIVGRLKDMFIVGGFNAYPAEIENILLRHPDIAQVAVIGIPDQRLGEVAMAFVVPRSGTKPAAAEIIAWSRDQMANYKVPRSIEFVAELPLNATGKVQKDLLRERASSSSSGVH